MDEIPYKATELPSIKPNQGLASSEVFLRKPIYRSEFLNAIDLQPTIARLVKVGHPI
jgi:hypothetical protein